jgi:hypothetical protein
MHKRHLADCEPTPPAEITRIRKARETATSRARTVAFKRAHESSGEPHRLASK